MTSREDKRRRSDQPVSQQIREHSLSNAIVSFQGERGAYSEKAILQFFDNATDITPKACRQFEDVFLDVSLGRTQLGMIPVENALTGSIHENFDLLLKYADLEICGEEKVRIQHCLIGTPDAKLQNIKRVYSHPQGLLQCEQFLDRYPAWEQLPFYDTAGSVAHIVEQGDNSSAAIAGMLSAEIWGAKVLVEGVETNSMNFTRFFLIRKREADYGRREIELADKASVVFRIADKPGALLEAMKALAARGINLQKIESRPIHGKPWTYMFYLDLQVPADTGLFSAALEDLAAQSEDLRLLGLYRAA